MTQLVITPTGRWLQRELIHCRFRFLTASPYVGTWLPKAHRTLASDIKKVLLTRTDLRDFASGASDLEAVRTLAVDGTRIISSHRLHAKVYVIDEACGLITSANATFSGMRGNLECGVAVRDAEAVREAANLILSAFGENESPQSWSVADLESLREPVRSIQEALTRQLITPDIESRELLDVSPNQEVGHALTEHLPGWTRLALKGVQMQATVFDLDSFVNACTPLAVNQYPNNRNVRPKLRQQLQRLRDLGLIQFLGRGKYRRNKTD